MVRLWQSLRYSLRALLKNPGFTPVAILSLAPGIGANVAIFTTISALLLRDLPVPHPGRLVELSVVLEATSNFLLGTWLEVGVLRSGAAQSAGYYAPGR